jgi:hypothetical protein
MAYQIPIPGSFDVSVKRRETFLSDSINNKQGVVIPEGVYRGFIPFAPSGNAPILSFKDSGAPGYDHVAVVRNSYGRSVTIRCPPAAPDSLTNIITIDLTGVAGSSPLEMVIAVTASYDTVTATSANFAVMLDSDWHGLSAVQKDTFVVLGKFTYNGDSAALSDVSFTDRTRAGDNISVEAAPRVELLRNNSFSLGASSYVDNSAPSLTAPIAPGHYSRSVIPFWSHEPSNTGLNKYPFASRYVDKYALWYSENGALKYKYNAAFSPTDTANINQSLGIPVNANNTLKVKIFYGLLIPFESGSFSLVLNFVDSSGTTSHESITFLTPTSLTVPDNSPVVFEQEYQCAEGMNLDSITITANNISSSEAPNSSDGGEFLNITYVSVTINPLDLAAPASIMATRLGDVVRARTIVLDNNPYKPSEGPVGSAARFTIDESASPGTVVLGSANVLDVSGTPAATGTQPNLHIRGSLTVDGSATLNGGYTAVSTLDSLTTGGSVTIGTQKASQINMGHTGVTTSLISDLNVSGATSLTGNLDVNGTTSLTGDLGVTGASSVTGNLSVGGTSTLTGALIVNNTINVPHKVTVGSLAISTLATQFLLTPNSGVIDIGVLAAGGGTPVKVLSISPTGISLDMNTASPDTDYRASIFTPKSIKANGTITAGTFTDGHLSITNGSITGASSISASGNITATSFTDSHLTITNGNISGAGTITATSLIVDSNSTTSAIKWRSTGSNGDIIGRIQNKSDATWGYITISNNLDMLNSNAVDSSSLGTAWMSLQTTTATGFQDQGSILFGADVVGSVTHYGKIKITPRGLEATLSSSSSTSGPTTSIYTPHSISADGTVSAGTVTDNHLTITNGNIYGAGTIAATGAITGRSVGSSGTAFVIGNDATLEDIDAANTVGLYGIANGVEGSPTKGNLKLGTDGPTLRGSSDGLALNMDLAMGNHDITSTGSFKGSVAAANLAGTSLPDAITGSKLTSVGTLTALTVTDTISGSISGNADTATKLKDPRNIAGVSFDGTQSIDIPHSGLSAFPTDFVVLSNWQAGVDDMGGTAQRPPNTDHLGYTNLHPGISTENWYIVPSRIVMYSDLPNDTLRNCFDSRKAYRQLTLPINGALYEVSATFTYTSNMNNTTLRFTPVSMTSPIPEPLDVPGGNFSTCTTYRQVLTNVDNDNIHEVAWHGIIPGGQGYYVGCHITILNAGFTANSVQFTATVKRIF